MSHRNTQWSRRSLLKGSAAALAGASTASVLAADQLLSAESKDDATANGLHHVTQQGPVGFTSFIHPTVNLNVDYLRFGAASFMDAFVSLNGRRAIIGNAVNLQDNDRLLNYSGGAGRGDLVIGDGSFTAHGVSFVGRVRVGQACGTGINAIVQNARIGDASFIGLGAQILGERPHRLIEIPAASLVLFGARIRSQDDVAANIIPVPAPFTLFFADVDEENLVLARGFNLLYRAAARMTPFSSAVGDPRNPGADFPDLATAFGKLSVAPPTIYRRGTGVIPGRQATLGDLSYQVFEPMSPVATPSTPAPDMGGLGLNAPQSDSPESGARFVKPRVASPELIASDAIVSGGCDLAAGVSVASQAYVLGDVAPAVSIGQGTSIGANTSVHELTFTSCRIGEFCTIGERCVLHGPLEVGNNVTVGDGVILFGPRIGDGVTIGDNALIFGPVEITEDVPANAIIVAPGNEFLIAPSAPTVARATLPACQEMLPQWRRVQQSGSCCGCGIGQMALVAAPA
ncbi:MAG: hypothetical protein Tsb002_28320 [Wenzhouxiangellaceae bacterium]